MNTNFKLPVVLEKQIDMHSITCKKVTEIQCTDYSLRQQIHICLNSIQFMRIFKHRIKFLSLCFSPSGLIGN